MYMSKISSGEMPELSLPISSNKADLVSIFEPYLLSSRYGYSTSSEISKKLVEEIISHRSFGAAFTYEIRGKKMKWDNISSAIENLASSIYSYLTTDPFNNSNDYDSWIKKIGENFLKDCSNYASFEFGKAQKIINVTMKHLYCYNVDEKYFQFSHVALDSMTYTGRSNNSLAGGFYKREVNPTASTKAFSNLSYEEYITVQNEIRTYLAESEHDYIDKSGNRLTPFKAEFYFWPRYKKQEGKNDEKK